MSAESSREMLREVLGDVAAACAESDRVATPEMLEAVLASAVEVKMRELAALVPEVVREYFARDESKKESER